MGRKYIIELEDKNVWECGYPDRTLSLDMTVLGKALTNVNTGIPLTPYTEPDMEQVRKEAYDKGYTDAAYNCHERCAFLDDAKKEAYQRGYETAKHECEDCPKRAYTDAIRMEGYQKGLSDAWEAARKICANWCISDHALSLIFGRGKTIDDIMREFTASEAIEKIQAYEQEKEEQIQVGDEVEAELGNAIVVGITENCVRCVYSNGKHATLRKLDAVRTSRHFPEIAAVLEKMRGEQDG